MSSPPAQALDAASAIAQAIGAILRAMLDAFFGDVSALAPRHPVRRAYERACNHIERYTAALEAALSQSAEEQAAPHPDSARNSAPRVSGTIPHRLPTPKPQDQARAPPVRPPGIAIPNAHPYRYDMTTKPENRHPQTE